jgi:hypothetical protein
MNGFRYDAAGSAAGRPTLSRNAARVCLSVSHVQGTPIQNYAGATLATGTNATPIPFTPANSLLGFSTGFGFASWLLGDYNSTNQTAPNATRRGYQQWGLFLQDTWKVNRKLTLDYAT